MNEFERAIKAATDLLTAMALLDRTTSWATMPVNDGRHTARQRAERLHSEAIQNFLVAGDDLSPPSLER